MKKAEGELTMRSILRAVGYLVVATGTAVHLSSTAVADASSTDSFMHDPAAIMQMVHRRGAGGAPHSGQLRLTTISSAGERRERTLSVRYKGDEDARRSYLVVDSPAEMRGTGFVSIEVPSAKRAERWLYLPRLKRAARIAGGQMSGSFLGSDLSFADLAQPDPSNFSFTLAKHTEHVNGEDCWVITGTARKAAIEEESGYREVQFWVSKQKFSIIRMRAPLLDGKSVKYIESSRFEQVDGSWMPRKTVVRTVEAGKLRSETWLEVLQIAPDPSVRDSDFTKQRLELGS
jgi:hypothetical protein